VIKEIIHFGWMDGNAACARKGDFGGLEHRRPFGRLVSPEPRTYRGA